jgi:hypothetical protein
MISWGHPPSPALPLCTALSIVAFFINGDSRFARQFHQRACLLRSVIKLDLKHGILGLDVQCAFLRGAQRRKYRFHPAINFQAKPFGQDKVRAGESFQSGDHRCRQGS